MNGRVPPQGARCKAAAALLAGLMLIAGLVALPMVPVRAQSQPEVRVQMPANSGSTPTVAAPGASRGTDARPVPFGSARGLPSDLVTGPSRSTAQRSPPSALPRGEPQGRHEAATPAITPQVETPPSRRDRAILQRFQSAWRILVWPVGSPIVGCFMEAKNVPMREAFLKATRAWTAHANLTFDFGSAPGFRTCAIDDGSEIRVSFKPALASRSEIGTLALDVQPGQPTLHISTGALGEQIKASLDERVGVMIHELGHALALPHEHQHPLSPCPAEYRFDLLCPRAEASHTVTSTRYASVLAVYSGQRALITDPDPSRLPAYDVKSVMHYRYPPAVLKEGRKSACYVSEPFVLSDGDKQKMRQLYPKDPAEQHTMIRRELVHLATAIGRSGISEDAAQSLKSLVDRRLQRKFPELGFKLDLDRFTFEPRGPRTIAIEEGLVAPLKVMAPVCGPRSAVSGR